MLHRRDTHGTRGTGGRPTTGTVEVDNRRPTAEDDRRRPTTCSRPGAPCWSCEGLGRQPGGVLRCLRRGHRPRFLRGGGARSARLGAAPHGRRRLGRPPFRVLGRGARPLDVALGESRFWRKSCDAIPRVDLGPTPDRPPKRPRSDSRGDLEAIPKRPRLDLEVTPKRPRVGRESAPAQPRVGLKSTST